MSNTASNKLPQKESGLFKKIVVSFFFFKIARYLLEASNCSGNCMIVVVMQLETFHPFLPT